MTALATGALSLFVGTVFGMWCCWPLIKQARKGRDLAMRRGDAWRDEYCALLRQTRTAGYSRDGQPYSWATVDSLIGQTIEEQ